jgi:hypothetical protein
MFSIAQIMGRDCLIAGLLLLLVVVVVVVVLVLVLLLLLLLRVFDKSV